MPICLTNSPTCPQATTTHSHNNELITMGKIMNSALPASLCRYRLLLYVLPPPTALSAAICSGKTAKNPVEQAQCTVLHKIKAIASLLAQRSKVLKHLH